MSSTWRGAEAFLPRIARCSQETFNRSSDYEGAIMGQKEAYTNWGHKHFYREEGLETVAKHIGFSEIAFVDCGISAYQDPCSLDTRPDQRDLNIYADRTK